MPGPTWEFKIDRMKQIRGGCITKTAVVIVGLLVLVTYLMQREVVTGVTLYTNTSSVPEDGVLQQRVRTTGQVTSDRGQENVKVLLVTYMRGGSSFLGELINRNPSACYWYEPVEAMYHSMYGVDDVLLPLDIIYYTNGSRRVYSAYEKTSLVEYTHNILSKRFESLPLHMFYNRLIVDKKSKWTQEFRSCLIQHYPGKNDWMFKWKCKECEITPTLDELNRCYRHTEKANGTVQVMTTKHQIYPECPEANQILCSRNCTASIYKQMETCEAVVSKAKGDCASKQIIGMKAIRMPMNLVGDLLKVDPNVKVVHYVRDPRGITASRGRTAWMQAKLSGKSWLKEITLLCKRIMDDVTARKELEQRFPGQFLTLRYEDFATDPKARGKEVYDFLNTLFPVAVEQWLDSSTHHSTGSKQFGTIRKNSTQTANSWRSKVPAETIKQWTEPCLNVLKELNYDI